MAIWPVLENENVISIEFAKAEFQISKQGYQFGMSSGDLGREIASIGKVIEEFRPERYLEIQSDPKRYAARVGIPGTNEMPEFLYLGVYIDGIHFVPGSRKLNLSFAIMFHAAVSAAQGYTDIREAIPTFVKDVENILVYFQTQLRQENTSSDRFDYRLYDVRRPQTIEKNAVQSLIAGGRPGRDV